MARRLRELVLWAGAALGLLAVAAGLAVAFGGFSFLIFRSGSMSPEIPTGGIALASTVDAADIRAGDVVSVTAANGERITHRVVSTTVRGGEATLVLKGDANATADSEVYVVRSAERVVGSVPVGGYVVAHALTPPGLVALGALSLMLILLTGGRREGDPDAEPSEEARTGRRPAPRHRGGAPLRRRLVAGGLTAVVAGGAGAALLHTTGTLATFTDSPRARSGAITAATVAPPSSIACDASSNTIRWTAPTTGTPTGYRMDWSYSGGSGSLNFAAGVLSGRPPAPDLTGNRLYTVTISAYYGGWTSAPTASTTIRGQNAVLTVWSC